MRGLTRRAKTAHGRSPLGYASMAGCLRDLEGHGQLHRIETELDPDLEIPAIQRRVYEAGGPALLFSRARGSRFPLVSNLFGTIERARFLFRDALPAVHRLVE